MRINKTVIKIAAALCCLSLSGAITYSFASNPTQAEVTNSDDSKVTSYWEDFTPLPMSIELPSEEESSVAEEEASSETIEEVSEEEASQQEITVANSAVVLSTVVEDPAEVKAMEKEDGQATNVDNNIQINDTMPEASPSPSTPSQSTGSSGGNSTINYADGWQNINGKTYYYSGGNPLTGWQAKSGFRYYFDASGILQTSVGIDVSKYQGNIDWAKVKAAGVDFAMIRVGFRGYGSGAIALDTYFMTNIKNAKAAGLKVGVYFYTQAITEQEAIDEANYTIQKVKESGVTLDYPIAYDIEYAASDARTVKLTNAQRTAFCNAFAKTVTSSGYKALIYSNKSWLEGYLNISQIPYDVWLAHFTDGITSYSGSYKIWQYSSTGSVNGISGNVDLNVSFY